MLKLQSIANRLGDLALSDISFEITGGEYFVLLGPSGAGKTVLIEMIAGLIQPDSGKMLWNNEEITHTPPQTRGFAVVYQDYALFPHLTVRQNIAYSLRAKGISFDQAQDDIRALTEMLYITDLLDRRPGNLSGGEQQRAALARALAARPKLLLLDEPLSAVDTHVRLKLRKVLKRINKTLNIPVLHVTHDTEEAMALADRIGIMRNNRLQKGAAPEQL